MTSLRALRVTVCRATAVAPAALLVPAGLLIWDLHSVLTALPAWSPTLLGISLFLLTSWALGTSLGFTLGASRALLLSRLPSNRAGLTLGGALDGALLWLVVVWGHSPALLQSHSARALSLLAALALGGALGRHATERFARVLAAGSIVLALLGLTLLLPRSDTYLRLALHGVLLIAMARLLPVRGGRTRLQMAMVCLAIVCTLFMTRILLASDVARTALTQRSVHARAWTALPIAVADGDGDRAVGLFGGRDCDDGRSDVFPGASERPDNGRDDNCLGGDSPRPARPASQPPSKAYGAARGRDILLVSIDSLRFDVTNELTLTRRALGPHAEFTRAVSPTPKTVTSLSSTLRGKPYRQVRFSAVPGLRGASPVADPSVSLGQALRSAGYRPLTVATHRYLDPVTEVTKGFEPLIPNAKRPYTSAEEAVAHVERAVRGSPAPTAIFLHFMESHHPYRYGDQQGPDSIEGLRRAVRYLDRIIAKLVQHMGRTRASGPVVAVFGDHGEEFGEHGGRLHASSVYAEQVRVGFLLAAPGVPELHSEAPVSTAILPATLLELIGRAPPSSMTEPSILSYLTGEAQPPTLAVSEFRGDTSSVGYTFANYRLLVDPVYSVHSLFEIGNDAFERVDLAQTDQERAMRLAGRARAWDERH